MSLLGGRFGTVDKAAFRVGKSQKSDGAWEYNNPVEVLLNPSSIKVSASTQMKKEEGVANDSTAKTVSVDGKVTPKGITEQMVDMTLIFNVVEAYNSKTENSDFKALASAATSVLSTVVSGGNLTDAAENALTDLVTKTDYTSLSILNSKICCYSPLLEASHKQVPVIFYWGNMIYAGLISKYVTTFNYFSSQGAPLGAEVALTLHSAINDEEKLVSASTQSLLGLIKQGGKLLREPPG